MFHVFFLALQHVDFWSFGERKLTAPGAGANTLLSDNNLAKIGISVVPPKISELIPPPLYIIPHVGDAAEDSSSLGRGICTSGSLGLGFQTRKSSTCLACISYYLGNASKRGGRVLHCVTQHSGWVIVNNFPN